MLLELYMMAGYWSCIFIVDKDSSALCALIKTCYYVHDGASMHAPDLNVGHTAHDHARNVNEAWSHLAVSSA